MRIYHRYMLPRLMHPVMGSHLLEAYRQRLASQAQGTVLELGFGSGPYYGPRQVTRLFALEPEAEMLELTWQRSGQAAFPVEELQAGRGRRMPGRAEKTGRERRTQIHAGAGPDWACPWRNALDNVNPLSG